MDILNRNDETFMKLAIYEAEKAFQADEVPVGAIIVLDNKIIAKAFNQVEMLNDATAHAEIIAITQASAKLSNWRLTNATLYVTKEPCAMCAGAMVNAKLTRLVYGVSDTKYGAAGTAIDITGFKGMLHNVDVTANVLAEESLALLQFFFKQKRLK